MRRLFDAMFCDLLLVPKARVRPSEAIGRRMLGNYLYYPKPWRRKV